MFVQFLKSRILNLISTFLVKDKNKVREYKDNNKIYRYYNYLVSKVFEEYIIFI